MTSTPTAAQTAEAQYLVGLTATGELAATAFATWNADTPATYGPASSLSRWSNDGAGNSLSGYAGTGTGGGTVTFAFDPSVTWTAAQQQAFVSALAIWSNEVNIQFAPAATSGAADVLFTLNSGSGTYERPAPHYQGQAGDTQVPVNLTPSAQDGGQALIAFDTSGGYGTLGTSDALGSYALASLVHEVGHLLGLGHAGPYDDSMDASAVDAAQNGALDSRQWSAMSYIDPSDTAAAYYASYPVTGTSWIATQAMVSGNTTTVTSILLAPETPMPLDILAAQLLYGAPTSTQFSGGQVFGFNSNVTGAVALMFDFTQNLHPVVTLWDTGSGNTLDLSGYTQGSIVSLVPGTFSSADGLNNNIGIAFGTAIDTAIGGAGNDTFTLNGDGDTIDGGAGTNTAIFTGGAGRPGIGWTFTTDGAGMVTADGSQAGAGAAAMLSGIQVLGIGDGRYDLLTTTAAGGATTIGATADGTDGTVLVDGGGDDTLEFTGGTTYWHAGGGTDSATLAGGTTDLFLRGTSADYTIGGNARGTLTLTDNVANRDGTKMLTASGGRGAVVFSDGSQIALAGSVPVANDVAGIGTSGILFQHVDGTIDDWTMNGPVIAASGVVGNPTTAWTAAGTGDFTGAGKAALVLQNQDGTIDIWGLDGQTLASSTVVANPTIQWHVAATGDFDGDGKTDILLQNDDGTMDVWKMDGAQIASSTVVANPTTAWHAAATADFNGDGKSDIVLQNTDGTVAIWQMQGATLTSSTIVADPGMTWRVVGAADFDGDGTPDILLQNRDGRIDIWTMNGTTIGSSTEVADPGPTWHALATGDYDGDGKADILFQNDDGTVDIWQMNGTAITASTVVANPGSSWGAIGGTMHFINADAADGTFNGTVLADDFTLTGAEAGSRTIAGFDVAHDVLTLDPARFDSASALLQAVTEVNGSTVIDLGNGSDVTLAGVMLSSLSAHNFV